MIQKLKNILKPRPKVCPLLRIEKKLDKKEKAAEYVARVKEFQQQLLEEKHDTNI